jgi:hypothetical protein
VLPLAAAFSLLRALGDAQKDHLPLNLFLLYVEALATRSFEIGEAHATEGVRLFFVRHPHERHELLSSGPMAVTYADLEYDGARCSGGLKTEVLGYQIVNHAVDPVNGAVVWNVVSLITQEEEHWTMESRLRYILSWNPTAGHAEWSPQPHWRAVRRRFVNPPGSGPPDCDIVPMRFTPPAPLH